MKDVALSRRLPVWGGFVVTAIFMYFAVRDAHFGEVADALAESNYIWLLPAFVVLALSIFLRAVRWRLMFSTETRPALGVVTRALLVGYLFNNILPARAGEAVRVQMLRQWARTSRAEAAGTVVIERAYDVLSLLVLLFVVLPWLPEVTWLRPAAALAVGLAVTLAVTMLVLTIYGDRPIRFAFRPLSRLPFLSSARVEQVAVGVVHGLAAVRRPGLALTTFVLTTVSWLVMAISFWLVMLAFELELSPLAGLFVLVAIGLSMILPSSPAAFGVFEAAAVVALRAYGVGSSLALSYALVLHALNFFPYLVAGGLALRPPALAVLASRSSRRAERDSKQRSTTIHPGGS
ncbi:MAG: flippase-like domain-containing protein [Actinomycetota bacterium]|nr:flippase-like domain-containing protein [Actinomycetota bacterium]